jgi:uncharacterized protein
MADELGGQQGHHRRRFFPTAAGVAAGFVVSNDVYGDIFNATWNIRAVEIE